MYLEDFYMEMTFTLPSVTIDQEEMIAFSKRYDPFPIHHDENYAKTTRFGKLIAPGVMSFMTLWAKFVEMDLFGEELIAGKSIKIEWFKPVFAGDVLTGEVRVSAITERNAYNGIVETTMDVRNHDGELVLSDITETVVKRK